MRCEGTYSALVYRQPHPWVCGDMSWLARFARQPAHIPYSLEGRGRGNPDKVLWEGIRSMLVLEPACEHRVCRRDANLVPVRVAGYDRLRPHKVECQKSFHGLSS